MTQVAFHFGAPDKLAYACRLLRKAVSSGARVLVLVPPEAAQALDAALWSISPTDFLPHTVRGPNPASQAMPAGDPEARSAVVLASDLAANTDNFGVLVNLSDAMPEEFSRFPRVIEVVSLDESDRQHARKRWKSYTEQGYDIVRHDLKLKGAA